MNLPIELVTEIELRKSNIEINEIMIPVPWGHIAGKWWGRRDCRPILVIHGWQDNAGSFDRLIPLLPKHVGYLAIDLPGHGLSSHLPPGMVYHSLDSWYYIYLIINYFEWDKVSFLCHSYGGIISSLYAGIFPERCDMIIAFDGLKPPVHVQHDIVPNLRKYIQTSVITDQKNGNSTEPPAYEYKRLLEKITTANNPVTREAAPYLLVRGITPSILYPNRWYFSRDQRLKSLLFDTMSQEITIELAKSIVAPVFYIKGAYPVDENYLAVLRKRDTFKFLKTDKCHRLHLTDPEYFKESVSEFILRYRPVDDEN